MKYLIFKNGSFLLGQERVQDALFVLRSQACLSTSSIQLEKNSFGLGNYKLLKANKHDTRKPLRVISLLNLSVKEVKGALPTNMF